MPCGVLTPVSRRPHGIPTLSPELYADIPRYYRLESSRFDMTSSSSATWSMERFTKPSRCCQVSDEYCVLDCKRKWPLQSRYTHSRTVLPPQLARIRVISTRSSQVFQHVLVNTVATRRFMLQSSFIGAPGKYIASTGYQPGKKKTGQVTFHCLALAGTLCLYDVYFTPPGIGCCISFPAP